MLYIPKTPSKATLQAEAIQQAQNKAYSSGVMSKYSQHSGMYSKAVRVIDMIQQYRKFDRGAILKGSIKDTGNPSGTAINMVLNAKTIADKNISKKLMKEWTKKTSAAILNKKR